MTNHPAKFSKPILVELAAILAEECERDARILDPFAGVGTIHTLPYFTVGIEIEPEWAMQSVGNVVGDALKPPFRPDTFDAIVTSPVYGNRMSDHHVATEKCRECEGEGQVCEGFSIYSTGVPCIVDCPKCGGTGRNVWKRNTYRHTLGRPLHENNSGQLQWGEAYRRFHAWAWYEAIQVLKPGGLFVLNVSDHIRKGEVMPVTDWHKMWIGTDLTFQYEVQVETQRQRQGENHQARVAYESVLVFRKV